jgi:hypothetical protein
MPPIVQRFTKRCALTPVRQPVVVTKWAIGNNVHSNTVSHTQGISFASLLEWKCARQHGCSLSLSLSLAHSRSPLNQKPDIMVPVSSLDWNAFWRQTAQTRCKAVRPLIFVHARSKAIEDRSQEDSKLSAGRLQICPFYPAAHTHTHKTQTATST